MPQAFSDTYLNVYLSIYILYFYCKHHASLCDVLSAHNVRHPDTCRRTRYHTLEPTLTQRLGNPIYRARTPYASFGLLEPRRERPRAGKLTTLGYGRQA